MHIHKLGTIYYLAKQKTPGEISQGVLYRTYATG